jgi:hypothetical protein
MACPAVIEADVLRCETAPDAAAAMSSEAATSDADGRAVVERFGVLPGELPLMVCPNGTVLKRPTDAEAGVRLGITPELNPETN